MRSLAFPIALLAALPATAYAGDKPVRAPVPSWVKPVDPPAAGKDDGAPIRLLLNDEQVSLQPGKVAVYREVQVKIQTPQGLAAGNISLPWSPDTDELTVHKLRIRRGEKVIDALQGHDFTVLRRETNLEMAMLDGVLTANIQPEGLQVGDVIEMATTITSSDPVLKNHVEEAGATWNGVPIGRAHLRVSWPANLKTRFRVSAGLPPVSPVTSGGITAIEMAQDDIQPLVPPKGAPARFEQGRILELTDFASWADLGTLMAPLYLKASTLAPNSPVEAEIQRIKSLSADPKVRAAAALALAQDRIRYVALAMGAGGLTPADADATWSRRYGDCKAKTALLLALLHGLGIQAQAVVVNAVSGDGFDQRLPMIALFNHVLVRATIAGKAYWLDGTRTGDTDLDRIAVPAFDWGLPLVPTGAALVRMLPAPLGLPSQEVSVRIDASQGISLPAPFKAEMVMRGDTALATNLALASLTGDAHDRAMREFWHDRYDFVEFKSATASFDAAKGEEHLAMEGLAKMDWNNGWYETDGTGIGYHADFSRDPGPNRDAPFAVAYPYFNKTVETIVLPPSFMAQHAPTKAEVNETIAGVEYRRHASLAGTTVTIEKTERSIMPEFPAQEAPAAQKRLLELSDQDVYIKKPDTYRETPGELKVLRSTASSADDFVKTGNALADDRQYAEAIADFSKAIELAPQNAKARADRAFAEVQARRYDDAERDIAAAQAIDPKSVVALCARGLLQERHGQMPAALASYDRALEIEPDNRWTLLRHVELNERLGNRPAAMADVTKALKLDSGWLEMRYHKAQLLFLDGKRDEAKAEAASLAASNPNGLDAQLAAGAIDQLLGDMAAATAAYDHAIEIAPSAQGYVSHASVHWNERAVASADIEAALKLDPRSFAAWSYKSKIAQDDGDFDGAITALNKAIEIFPDDPALHAQMGNLYRDQGKLEDARREADTALGLDPHNVPALTVRADLLQRSGDPKQAIAVLTSGLGNGADTELLARRAGIENSTGDHDAALRDSALVLVAKPTETEMRLLRANIFQADGKPEEAVAEAAALERDNPKAAYAHVAAGKIYAAFKRTDNAMAAFSAALAIKPEAYIYLNRGESRSRTDVSGKLSDFDAALRLDPALLEAAAAKADLLNSRGDIAGAIATYDTIIARKPTEPFMRLKRGILLAKQGDSKRAAEDLDAAHASPKFSDPSMLNTSCWALATANVELQRALAYCEAALRTVPDNSSILDSRAFVLLRMGRIDDSIAAYGQALARNPRSPSSLFGRAVAWARKDDKAKSDADLAAALKIDSNIRETFSGYGVTL